MDGAANVERVSGVNNGPLPAEFAGRFNWGACGLGCIWALAQRLGGVAVLDAVLMGLAVCGPAYCSATPTWLVDFRTSWVAWAWLAYVGAFIAWRVMLGRRGHGLAWRRRRLRDVEQYRAVHLVWHIFGIALGSLGLAALMWYPVAGVVIGLVLRAAGMPALPGVPK